MQGNILLILKPEIFDHSISRENDDDIFLSGITIPSPDILLDQLFLDIVSVYR